MREGGPGLGIAGLKALLLVVVPFLLFIVAEVAVLIWVSQQAGWWTLLILLASTIIGAVLLQREWRRNWSKLAESLKTGSLPPGRAADAVLILLGGVLLIMPGFITDVVGLSLLLPFTRPMVRSAIGWWAGRALARTTTTTPAPTVIRGEVVEDEADPGVPQLGEPERDPDQ